MKRLNDHHFPLVNSSSNMKYRISFAATEASWAKNGEQVMKFYDFSFDKTTVLPEYQLKFVHQSRNRQFVTSRKSFKNNNFGSGPRIENFMDRNLTVHYTVHT